MTERRSGTTEEYVVQRQWLRRGTIVEWVDYYRATVDLDEARELLSLGESQSGFSGPWRIIHRVTAVVETVVDP